MGSGCGTVGVLQMVEWLCQTVGCTEEYAFPTEGQRFFMVSAKVFAGPTENAESDARGWLASRVR